MLKDLKLADFIEAVSAKTPTPGGGSVAAAASAMGAALGIMAPRVTDHADAAGIVGCGLNVKINAGLMSDAARRAKLEQEAGRIEQRAAELRKSLLASK